MKNHTTPRVPFRLGDNVIEPGHRKSVNLPATRLYTQAEMTIPVMVLHGRKPGPVLFVSATIHGDEILGVDIIRRLLQVKELSRLHGTLLAVPVVNAYGFIQHSRYLPDRRDLNRFFPGSETGSLTSQLANTFFREIVQRCTHGIDIHSGAHHRMNYPHVRAWMEDPATSKLAHSFGAPVILNSNIRDGSLRQAVLEHGIPILLYEAGEALRFDEKSVRAGLRGILNVMRSIGMLPPARTTKTAITPVIAESSTWVRAPESGILSVERRLGAHVSAGERLGVLSNVFGEPIRDVTATENGLLIAASNLPMAHKGDALFHLACPERLKAAVAALESFEEEFAEML